MALSAQKLSSSANGAVPSLGLSAAKLAASKPLSLPLPSTLPLLPRVQCAAKTSRRAEREPAQATAAALKSVGTGLMAAAAAATLALSSSIATGPALAVLNRFEADRRGEFGIGSAAQYGSADLRATDHKNENFRRANFTSADMREADFSGCNFVGGYLEKSVAYRTNFEGADFTDALMDRMVLNEANLTNAVLVRTVLTRSDLGKAKIEGADFSDAVIDLPQKQALCKVAKGVNPVTGMSTRTSLGCSNKRGNAYGTPSAPLLSDAPEKFLTRDGFCDESSGLCDAS